MRYEFRYFLRRNRLDIYVCRSTKYAPYAGATLVIIKDDILGQVSRQIPSMLHYQVNLMIVCIIPRPLFCSVCIHAYTQWLKDLGGIAAVEEINDKKASLIYSEIDLNPLFNGFAKKKIAQI